MELDDRVERVLLDPVATALEVIPELAAETARLRRLVGELLLKNQRLREAAMTDTASWLKGRS